MPLPSMSAHLVLKDSVVIGCCEHPTYSCVHMSCVCADTLVCCHLCVLNIQDAIASILLSLFWYHKHVCWLELQFDKAYCVDLKLYVYNVIKDINFTSEAVYVRYTSLYLLYWVLDARATKLLTPLFLQYTYPFQIHFAIHTRAATILLSLFCVGCIATHCNT